MRSFIRFINLLLLLPLLSPFLLFSARANNFDAQQCQATKYKSKPRVFVNTDIGNEPDDQMSLVRFLTYSNEFQVEGIAATTSSSLNTTQLPIIQSVLAAYAKVVDNLNANVPIEGKYPTAECLNDILSTSKDVYGLEALNGPLSTAAAAMIKAVDSSDQNLWVVIWGGSLVVAEVLNNIQKTRSTPDVNKFVDKLRVYAISDQDDSGPWIRINFPSLFYIVSIHAFSTYNGATWTGISGELVNHFDQGGPDSSLVSEDWLQINIRVGELGAHYPQYLLIMEGDTPSFLYLVRNGLGDPEHPIWGSWGGRYGLVDSTSKTNLYSDTIDGAIGVNGLNFTSNHASVWRWRRAYQYDFAARMNWSTTSDYHAVNHAPVVILNETCGPDAIQLNVTGGTTYKLDASQSFDPDGDNITFHWAVDFYTAPLLPLAASYFPNLVDIKPLNTVQSVVEITPHYPNLTGVKLDYQLILTVSDSRDMEMVAYRRVILNH